MITRQSALACAVALAASVSASYAGPCQSDIYSMQAKINAKLEATVAAGPSALPSARVGTGAQPTQRSMAAVAERMGEISHETAQAVEQGMARARAADAADDKAGCEQALAEVQRFLDK